jgi:hypothetical protein
MPDTVLVLGDLVIDRTWLVGEAVAEKRFTAHRDVLPRQLVDPSRNTDVAGGIGTLSRALGAIGQPVIMAGIWDDVIEGSLLELVPPEQKLAEGKDEKRPRRGNLSFCRLGQSRFTSMRHRIYAAEPKGARLMYRFDRDIDVSSAPPFENAFAELRNSRDIVMVVLADYKGKVLARNDVQDLVRDIVRNNSPRPPIVFRTADAALASVFEPDFLTLNLYWFAQLTERDPFDLPVTKQVKGECTWHPRLVEALKDFPEKVTMKKGGALLLNLEEDGALLLHDDQIKPLILAAPDPVRWLNVGANDVQLARIVHSFLQARGGRDDFGNLLEEVCEKAVPAGSAFSSHALSLELDAGVDFKYYAAPMTVSDEDVKSAPPVLRQAATPLATLSDALGAAREIGKILAKEGGELPPDPKIHLHDAQWYLEGFLTIDPVLGDEITRLKQRMRDYLTTPSSGRPFVAALCGEPGAGKSTLAKALAAALGCEPIFDNAAQWTGAADLFGLCERIRTAQMQQRKPLVLIDEADATVGNEQLYGKLLAPVWDGQYVVHGDVRTLGLPTIFLLAGSNDDWKLRENLLRTTVERADPKLGDLVSRLTARPIEVPALQRRSEDIVYLVAYHLLKRFPRLKTVEEGLLRLIARSKCRYGSRSISSVIDLMTRPAKHDHIDTDVLPRSCDDDLNLYLDGVPDGWRGQHAPIAITA